MRGFRRCSSLVVFPCTGEKLVSILPVCSSRIDSSGASCGLSVDGLRMIVVHEHNVQFRVRPLSLNSLSQRRLAKGEAQQDMSPAPDTAHNLTPTDTMLEC